MIEFTKAHGNGNDFIVLENLDGSRSSEELSRLARLLCRRKFSIGADGILVVEKAESADFTMRIFNADGSEGEMCGNGARVMARYAFEKKLAGQAQSFMTLAGRIKAQVEPPYAELDMGELELASGIFGQSLKVQNIEFPFVFVTVGVPHCVLFTEDYDGFDVSQKIVLGRELAHDSRFPGGCNVSFAQALHENMIRAVTYERGVEDLTESCGTGSVAVAIAMAAIGRCTSSDTISMRIQNPGGINEVRLLFAPDNRSCHAWLKGKTALVSKGRILEDSLSS